MALSCRSAARPTTWVPLALRPHLAMGLPLFADMATLTPLTPIHKGLRGRTRPNSPGCTTRPVRGTRPGSSPSRQTDPMSPLTLIDDPAALRARGSLKWTGTRGDIAAWVAESDLGTAPAVTAALHDAIARGLTGYLPPRERSGAARACADWQRRRYGWDVPADRVRLVADVIWALRLTIEHLTAPGSAVVLPTPGVHAVRRAAGSMGARGAPGTDVHRSGWSRDARPRGDRRRAGSRGRTGRAGQPPQPDGQGAHPRRARGARRRGGVARRHGVRRRDPRPAGARRAPARALRVGVRGRRAAQRHRHLGVEGLERRGPEVRSGGAHLRRPRAAVGRPARPCRGRLHPGRRRRRGRVRPRRGVARRGRDVPRRERPRIWRGSWRRRPRRSATDLPRAPTWPGSTCAPCCRPRCRPANPASSAGGCATGAASP